MTLIKLIVTIMFILITSITAQSTLTFTTNSGTDWNENGIDWHIYAHRVGSAYVRDNGMFCISDGSYPGNFLLETNHKLNIISFQISALNWDQGGTINGNLKITGYDVNGNVKVTQNYNLPDNQNIQTDPLGPGTGQVILNSFTDIMRIEFEYSGRTQITIDDLLYTDLGLAYSRPYPGNGTLADPFQISTLSHLQFLSEHPFEWIYYFIQTANIDAAATSSGVGFQPIGLPSSDRVFFDLGEIDYLPILYLNDYSFKGGYDGKGFSISNLHINRPTSDYVGLFGVVTGIVINLGIRNSTITGNNSTGALAGLVLGSGKIGACYSVYCTVSGNQYVGGLIGSLEGLSSGQLYVDCSATTLSNIWGNSDIGGLVGLNYGSIINNSYCTESNVTLYYSAEVKNAGGLVGTSRIGDPFGFPYPAVIRNSFSSSAVRPTTNTGGLIGEVPPPENPNNIVEIIVENSFWDTQTSMHTVSAGGSGKTTAEMKTMSTYSSGNWDFTNFWVMIGSIYPDLRCFYNIAPPAQLTAYLEGPFNNANGNMNKNLSNIPFSSPYTADPQTVNTIPPNTVDWILVELRDKSNKTAIITSRSALLLNNGSIVDIDGITPLQLGAFADNYYVVVKHRNHLPIMSKEPISFNK